MSDEQPPPPPSLRLKPRINLDPAQTPPSVPDASPAVPEPPVSPAPAAVSPDAPVLSDTPAPQSPAGEPLKFRLKPKTPPPEGLPAETPLPFPNSPIPVEPPATPPVVIAPVASPPAALPPPLSAAVPPIKPMAPPFLAAKAPPAFRPPAPQHLQTPRSLTEPPPLSVPLPASLPASAPPERAIKADKWLAALVVLVVVIGGATWGVRQLFLSNPKPSPTANFTAASAEEDPAAPAPAAPAKPVPGGQTKLVEKPQSAAGKAVARARDTVAAVERREHTEGTTSVLDEAAATPPAPQQNLLTPNTPPRTPVVEEVPADAAEPAVPPSEAFRNFVVSLRVNGVFQGENPRAMLNGKMYNVGAEVDPKLAITLFKIEPEAKQLVFRDDTGAILSRRY